MPNKQQLIRFLEQHVFDPIMQASSDRLDSADQKRLKDVQDRTRTEKQRFQHYGSSEEIIKNYKSDLHSAAARRVNSELEKLKLPTLASVREQFLELAEHDDAKSKSK